MGHITEAVQKDGYIEIKINAGKLQSGDTLENSNINNNIIVQELNKKKVYLIGKNILGSGSEDLGKLLMKGFIYKGSSVTVTIIFRL